MVLRERVSSDIGMIEDNRGKILKRVEEWF